MPRPAVDEIFTGGAANTAQTHGPAPRLRYADGWDSWLSTRPAADAAYMAILTRPAVMSAPSMTVHVQMASDTGIRWIGIYLTRLGDLSGRGVHIDFDNSETAVTVPARTWIKHTFTLAPGVDYNRSAVESLVAEGQFAVLAAMDLDGDFDASTMAYVSQLDLILGPLDQPLRWRQRDDGLGVSGPPRARGATSRQRSNRARAYL